MYNLKVIGYIPNVNRRQSYSGYDQPVQAASQATNVADSVIGTVKPVKAKSERVITNAQRYKAGVIKAWKRNHRGFKVTEIISTKLN